MTEYDDLPAVFRRNIGKDIPTEAELMSDKATQAISGLTAQYVEQAKADLQVMKKLLAQARKATPGKRFRLMREDFFMKVHDMKGQGSTFGYPLLTEVGACACDYLRNKTEVTPEDLDVLTRLVADIERILTDDLTGMGGLAGSEIRAHLGSSAK